MIRPPRPGNSKRIRFGRYMFRPSIGMLYWYLHKYILSFPDLQTTMGHTDDTIAGHINDCMCLQGTEYIDFERDLLQLKNFPVRMALASLLGYPRGSNDQLDR